MVYVIPETQVGVVGREMASRTYCIDFDRGRVRGTVDGSLAVRQAVMKILRTERFDHLIYSWNYGFELKRVLGKSFEVLASEVKRLLREALLQDVRIISVEDICVVKTGKRTAGVSFLVGSVFGEIPIDTEVIL